MTRWRCCKTTQCVLAEADGQAFASGQWIPTGDFTNQALASWYLELEFTEDVIPQAALDLKISDESGEAPFHLELASDLGYLFFRLNDLGLGYRRPQWACRRVLIGIEDYTSPAAGRQVALGACAYDDQDSLIDSMVWPLDQAAELALIFERVRTSIAPQYIQRARLGRLMANDSPCCPALPRSCLVASATPGMIAYVMPHATFTRPLETILETFEIDDIRDSEIDIELCTDACSDPDGFYRIVVQPSAGLARLRWVQCGHSQYETDVALGRFIPPEPDHDMIYRFTVCVRYASLGGMPAILCHVGGSTAGLLLKGLPFEHLTNCLRSPTFCADHFDSDSLAMTERLRRLTPASLMNFFPYSANGSLTRQAIGCPCGPTYDIPPAMVLCHGYSPLEIPPENIVGLLTIKDMPDLYRPGDDGNITVFFPLSLACHSYPQHGLDTEFCWTVMPGPGKEFAEAFKLRNPGTNWDLVQILGFCQMGKGVLCDYYPPGDPHAVDPFYLTYSPARTMEYAIYVATTYMLASRPGEIISAEEDGVAYLCIRLRSACDYGNMRIWYVRPVPFPLLRPTERDRLPPVPSRTFTFSPAEMAGFYSVPYFGPEAEAYIRESLCDKGELEFTMNYLG